MPYFRTPDGCRLFFEFHTNDRINHSPVIVFLNGFTQTTLLWKYQVEKFKDRYQVITYDARAQGNSDAGDFPLTLTRHARDLEDLLTFLKIENAHFIGISLGAKISLTFAERQPHKVNSLILCSIAIETGVHAHQVFQTAEIILEQNGIESMAEYLFPYLSGRYYSMKSQKIKTAMAKAIVKRNNKGSLLAQLKALQTYSNLSAIKSPFQIPTLVITGSADQMIPKKTAEQLAKHLDGRWELIDDAGHCIPLETPDLFYSIIRQFIAS